MASQGGHITIRKRIPVIAAVGFLLIAGYILGTRSVIRADPGMHMQTAVPTVIIGLYVPPAIRL